MTAWDPGLYDRYGGERTRPALDLIGALRGEPRDIWDLGCGTGAITSILAERWPQARVRGLDSSADMLREARPIAGIEWIQGRIEDWAPDRPVDLIFSNAALQWVDGHEELIPRLAGHLAPGGTLAIQMPRNFGEPSHTLLADTARSERWRASVGHVVRDSPVAPPAHYLRLLRGLVADVDIWETTYLQVLRGPDPVLEWTRATGARPYLAAAGDRSEEFLADYRDRLRTAYPPEPDGTTVFPFRRLFIVARR